LKKKIFKLVSFFIIGFLSSFINAKELTLQSNNSLDVFVHDYKKSSFKFNLSLGSVNGMYAFKEILDANSYDEGFSYTSLGIEALYSKKQNIEAGILFNYGLGGKDNFYTQVGFVFKHYLTWLKFFEPLYIKTGYTFNYLKNTFKTNNDLYYVKCGSSGFILGLGLNFNLNKNYYMSFDFLLSQIFVDRFKVENNNVSKIYKDEYLSKAPSTTRSSITIGYLF
jgi:hypothetical protein